MDKTVETQTNLHTCENMLNIACYLDVFSPHVCTEWLKVVAITLEYSSISKLLEQRNWTKLRCFVYSYLSLTGSD